mmetsp:Transcript_53102/g.160888  ORF Transcript_53102/g.160888 Transcript_53102/m.160888 type:complete len:306 (-) Transcript_53102:482-1399(-)
MAGPIRTTCISTGLLSVLRRAARLVQPHGQHGHEPAVADCPERGGAGARGRLPRCEQRRPLAAAGGEVLLPHGLRPQQVRALGPAPAARVRELRRRGRGLGRHPPAVQGGADDAGHGGVPGALPAEGRLAALVPGAVVLRGPGQLRPGEVPELLLPRQGPLVLLRHVRLEQLLRGLARGAAGDVPALRGRGEAVPHHVPLVLGLRVPAAGHRHHAAAGGAAGQALQDPARVPGLPAPGARHGDLCQRPAHSLARARLLEQLQPLRLRLHQLLCLRAGDHDVPDCLGLVQVPALEVPRDALPGGPR